MKISSMISNLHNSTKATVIACSVLIAVTAVVLFFLMLFPIQARDKSAALAAPIIIETTTTEALPTELFTTTKEPPHTLSTWAASVETIETTSDPNEIPWYDKLFTTTQQTDKYGNVIITTTTAAATTVITQPPTEILETAPATQPLTMPEPVTESSVQTITEVVTEPPVTAPSTEELTNAAPVAPGIINE